VSTMSSRNFPPGDLRVSDADRDQAVSELSEHYQAGRLTADELEERSGLALRARTGNDLAALLADLPPRQHYTAPAAAGSGQAPPPAPRFMPVAGVAIAALIGIAALSFFAAGSSGGHPFLGLVPILVLLLIARRLSHRHFRHEHHHHVHRHEQDRLP
jgi:Domain of unknown function (DUF1707)